MGPVETNTSATRYCRKCGYALCGLAEARCPECGRGFDLANPALDAAAAAAAGDAVGVAGGDALVAVVLLLAGAWG